MSAKRVLLDINNPEFLENLLNLDKEDRNRVLDTLKKVHSLDWDQVYLAKGLNWEKIISVAPPKGIDAIYSLRITKARRATAYRHDDFMVFLTIQPDHDATYGKK
jgi:hypothetical protein